ncbi:PLP-dependent transferase [Lactarius hengduanensis]|nr:PLP-dependent transferase [Lactarius hengduanensis]
MAAQYSRSKTPLGNPIPAFTEHAISVSLPTWGDNVGYEEGEARVIDAMQTGYPRFFINLDIRKLSTLLEQKFGTPSENSLLFPSRKSAEACRAFLAARDVLARVQFWQHTGLGISSRLATRCLSALASASSPTSPTPPRLKPSAHRHYASSKPAREPSAEPLGTDQSVYLEQRYGRNLDVGAAEVAKAAMRRRIAGVLVRDGGEAEVEVAQSVRGVAVTEHDVFLFPTGMSAIWSAHQLALDVRGAKKSVCLGPFPYTDTLKVLEKWGPGCYFLGHGLDSSIDELEGILEVEQARTRTNRQSSRFFTEFPIGNFINVETLPFADMVATSLTKLFSGDSNVMGGSLVLNPARKHYAALKERLLTRYEDVYFDEDAIFMERNSRNFSQRAAKIDANAERVCDLLHATSQQGPSSPITEVFYPKWQTATHYARAPLTGRRLRRAHRSLRVSVGLEDPGWLHDVFASAVRAAEEAHRADANAGA